MVFEVTTVPFFSGWDMTLPMKGAFDNNKEIVPRQGQENMVYLSQNI